MRFVELKKIIKGKFLCKTRPHPVSTEPSVTLTAEWAGTTMTTFSCPERKPEPIGSVKASGFTDAEVLLDKNLHESVGSSLQKIKCKVVN